MHRASSELPGWQTAPRLTYRRSPLLKRYRIFILFVICVFFWRWHMPTFAHVTAESIATSSSRDLENLELRTVLDTRRWNIEVTDILPSSEDQTTEDGKVSSQALTEQASSGMSTESAESQGEPEDVEARGTTASKANAISDTPSKAIDTGPQILGEASEKDELKDEPEDDETPEKSGSNPKKTLGNPPIGDSNAPIPLVREASQKIIDQHLSPAVMDNSEKSPKTTQHAADSDRFPGYAEYAAMSTKAESLPDIIHVNFEDSTNDVTLVGWEDAWFAHVEFNVTEWGTLPEPKIDFVYTWVNGSDEAFRETIYPYELNSTLNDPDGQWLEAHRVNRYRDWDELRYSIRSVEKYASSFRNKIQLLVNAVAEPKESLNATVENPASIIGKQEPLWLNEDRHTRNVVQILSQEDFFDESEQGCLPTFNSLTIENQLFNTKSNTDRLFALSDDMLLGKPHAASDIYSPLFGPTMGFKSNSYNQVNPPTDLDARRFGEKPFLIYTSWLLNRRFGDRKRKGQVHFGHSLSRTVMREAIKSFPRPALQSSCQRFRGETGFQLYSWYIAFHYTIERQREALLWSYIMQRSDVDKNGNLDWAERQAIMQDLEEGMAKEGQTGFRKRMFYNMNEALENAGLEAPKVNVDVQWTSLDGPASIKDIECFEFNVNECLAPGFSTPSADETHQNYVFSTASILDRVARQHPKCGDCLLKLLLNRVEKGLSPLLPHAETQMEARTIVIKALWKYQYVIVDPDSFFVMITDAEQVENVLFKRLIKRRGKVGQLCLNDDVSTEEEQAVADVRKVMIKLLEGIVPDPSPFEKQVQL